jgi:hypothetical protein
MEKYRNHKIPADSPVEVDKSGFKAFLGRNLE